MRYIGPYDLAVTPSYAALAAVSTAERRVALAALAGIVDAAGATHAAAVPDVHLLVATVLTVPQKSTLIDGYDGRSAAVKRHLERMRKSLGQEHRDLCPFCSLESTAQLDHFLPKQKYPEFSLYGPNLLPICPICNQSKGVSIVNQAGERLFLMPTADMAADQRVLTAVMTFNPVPRLTYSIDQNAHLAPPQLALVERHFVRLNLAKRYRRRAHSLVAAIKANVRKAGRTRAIAHRAIHQGHGTAHMEEPTNSWRVALYDAIIANAAVFEDWLIA